MLNIQHTTKLTVLSTVLCFAVILTFAVNQNVKWIRDLGKCTAT